MSLVKCKKATFDATNVTANRTAAAHPLGVFLPDNAVILGGFVDVLTTFTSTAGGTDKATLAIMVQGANDIVSAVAIETGTPWDAGIQTIIPISAATAIKLTAAREIVVTIGTQAVTGGIMEIVLDYVVTA
jgi:hypothetical protein